MLHGRLLERVDSTDHLIQEHAKRPPVDRVRVPVCLDNLRREILWRTAESVCHTSIHGLLLDLRQAEIGQLEMTL